MSASTTESLQPLPPLLKKMLGHRPSPATIWRWHTAGLKVGDRRVKLRALRIGARLYGTREDVAAFIDAQNPPEPVDDANAGERTPEMERRLKAAGLL